MHRHFILNKPYGYLSQFVNNQNKRRNKKLLKDLGEFPESIMAIGRLDEKSEGLLLLTTDGKLSQKIRSRKYEKEYYVQLDGVISDQALSELSSGVEISLGKAEKYKTLAAMVERLSEEVPFADRSQKIRDPRHGPTSWISVTIREGKFRQVRKMTAAVGFPTLRLVRVRIANTLLNGLEPGEFIEVESFNLD